MGVYARYLLARLIDLAMRSKADTSPPISASDSSRAVQAATPAGRRESRYLRPVTSR